MVFAAATMDKPKPSSDCCSVLMQSIGCIATSEIKVATAPARASFQIAGSFVLCIIRWCSMSCCTDEVEVTAYGGTIMLFGFVSEDVTVVEEATINCVGTFPGTGCCNARKWLFESCNTRNATAKRSMDNESNDIVLAAQVWHLIFGLRVLSLDTF